MNRRLTSLASTAVAAALALVACDSPSGTEQAGPPARLDIVSGNQQLSVVGTELPDPLVVRVTDDKGKPVRDQIVNFRVVSGGGDVFAGAALTNADGQAQERWTLGPVAGDTQRVEARAVDPVTGQALVFATFTAVGRADVAAQLSKVGGDALQGDAGATLADSVAVRVEDRFGNPVEGTTVTFSTPSGGAVSPATGVSGANGIVRTAWTLGPSVGTQTLAAASGTLPGASFTATALPPRVIAFTSSRDGNNEIYVMALDGSRQLRLTNHPFRDEVPAWSFDGQRIAFARLPDAGNPASLMIMNADGSGQVQVPAPGFYYAPAWSPDGTRLAYTCGGPSAPGICVVNTDGSGFLQVATGGFDPDWSPDGSTIAFTAAPCPTGPVTCTTIAGVAPDGTGLRTLVAGGDAQLRTVKWSPDGTRLLMTRDGIPAVANADGSNLHNVVRLLDYYTNPAWSPDQASFVVAKGFFQLVHLPIVPPTFVVPPVPLTTQGTNRYPAWRRQP